MTASQPKSEMSTKSYKERLHRYSALTISEIISIATNELGLTNIDVQIALGYPRPNVIAMIKKGSMGFPPDKSAELARLFKLDTAFILRKALQESNASLYDTIMKTIGKNIVTENEFNLLSIIREKVGGFDVNLADNPKFRKSLDTVLDETNTRQEAEKQASIERIAREAQARKEAAAAKIK